MIELFLIFFLALSGGEAQASSLNSILLLENAALQFKDTIGTKLDGQKLTVVLEVQDPKVNAELTKKDNELTIKVWGGMLKHQLINEETLLLLLCHEIGHFLGGPPTKAKGGWSSTEGQADYFSSLRCARDVGLDEVSFYESAINLTRIYASVTFSPEPRLEQCDTTIVVRTNFGYPSVQCRLDTLIAGWRKELRPQCWFSQ